MSRSDEWIGADTPLDEFFVGTDQQGTYDPQEGIAPETLGEMLTAGSIGGGWGVEANINYLDAAFQAITGDEWEMEQALDRARIAEEFAGEAMKDLPVWADFVNEPTAEGFFEQASIGLGQFLPSAFNSIAAATLVGGLTALASVSAPATVGTAAVGTAVLSVGGRQIFSKAGLKAAKKIFRDAMDKKSRKLKMSQAEWDLNEGVYSTAKKMFIGRPGPGRAGRYGAYVGAGGQEGAMGTGITFGEFARQDMTSPREAAISFGVGVPYALVGLGSEALALRYVFGPLMKVASTRAAKSLSPSSGYHSLVSDLSKIGIKGASKGIAVGGGVGMLAEGGAEAIQDTMTGLQKLAIDPNYDSAQMKMDIMESAFKGAIGGFALGGAGRGVTQAARDMINEIQLKKEGQIDMFGPDEDLNKQRRDLIKVRDAMSTLQQDLDSIKIKGTDVKTEAPEINFPDLETRQMDFFDMVPDFGAPMEENMEDIKAQFRASLSGHSGKDSVWIPQGHTIPSKQELDSIYGNKTYYSEHIPGRGTIFSISKGKVNYVVNQNASLEALSQVLGMYEPKNASHDRGILVKDKEGRVVHSETTNAQNQEAVIELQKETFNKTEQGKATYIVDEQPRHLEDISQDRRDSFIEEVESGSYVTRAVDEFNNALNLVGPPKDRQQVVENVLGRYIDNYPVLKAIYDNLKGKKDEPSIKARELLQDRLVGMLKDMNKKYSEALGIPVDAELTMALAGLNPNFGQEKTIEKASPTTKITAELEMAQEEQSKELGAITTGEEGVTEGAETTGVEQEEGQLYGFSIIGEMDESQFNKVTIIGKEGTINQEAQPWQIARPRGNESQEIFNLSQDILSTMTADEAATFSSNQLMMANTPFNFPIGVLKAYKEVRAAQPNATLKIRSRYIAKETSTLKTIEKAANNIFTPFNVLEFFNRNPNLAMASGLKYQELGFVIETTASPEEILIEYDDTGSKIKGKLTPDQYFERLVVEARRSKQEFREKSNWTLVSPDKKVEKVNIVSMIKGARAIVNAEGNYVPGDLKSVYQAMTSLFALADRNGYDFKLDNKSLLRNEFTPGQLLNSKAVVYVSHRPHTFGELLRYNLTNETSYGDMLGQSANLLEAILDKSALNKKEILELVNGGPSQIIEFVDGKWKETQEGKTYRDFAQFNEEETAIVPEISRTDEGMLAKNLFTEAKKIRDPKKAKDIRTRAKALQRSADLFAFKDILDGLYQVAVDQEVDVSSYELSYTGLDKDTFGVEERFAFDESELDLMLKSKMISDAQESGMEVSDWYDTPAKDMVHNSKYSYVTEYANRQYSSSSKTNHTLRSKNRKINITESESFKKHLGVVNDQFNAVLREFKYFGVSNDIHFMTFEDFIHPNSKPSKAQKILNEWYGPKMADNLAKAYWHRRKNAPDGEGLTIRASKNSPWIVVIDTGPLLNANARSNKKINIWSTETSNKFSNLSNLRPRDFVYEGRQYKSVEHAYQSLKSGEFDEAIYNNSRWGTGSVKIVGRKGTDKKTNVALMENIMRTMFQQNPKAVELLRNTGNATLTHNQDRGIWKETFPEILMKIRGEKGGKFAVPTNVPVKAQKKGVVVPSLVAPVKEKVELPGQSRYKAKDQAKSDKANKFIGVGAIGSSTMKYLEAWGERGNTGIYNESDVVFISVNGQRKNRIKFDEQELQLALDAGATIITDNRTDRTRSYNIGEREVAEFLENNNYKENNGNGIWEKAVKAKEKAWARYNRKEGVVYLDESELRKRFKDKAWTKPKVKGVKALPEGQFKTLDEWRNFVTRHEFAHAKYPQQEGESKADYENRINQLALAVDERGQDIIDETAAVGKVSTALAHELAGHVVINDILDSVHFKPWRDKLYKEYQKDVANGYKFSFDEWNADEAGKQLFHYATYGKFKPANNAVDSFFRRMAKQILDIWTSIVDGIGRKRMNLAEPNETFGEFWQEIIRLSKEGYAFDRAEGKLNHMEQKQIYDMVEQTAKPFNLPPSLWKQLSNKVSDIVQDLQSPGGISRQTSKLLYSASGFAAREEFGAPGKRASDFFYHLTATATKDGEGLTYLQQQTRDFIQLSNEFGKTINIDETGSIFLGLDEEATSALYLYQNDTITDKQLLDEKKYGDAGKMAHDLRVGFMRERVFFGYAMADGKDGTPVMKKLKLEENYQTPGDESTKVSFAHREWWLDRIRSEDTVRQDLTDVMVKKIINRTLLGYKKNGEAFVIEPNNLKATKDMPVEEFAQWWAETKITNILRLPHDNTLAESIPADILETEINNVDIGFPAALARTFRVQYLPDLDGAVDENGNPIIKMYGILNQELEEIGALVDPQLAMVNYLRTLTKKFAFEDRGGRAYLENLVENTPGHLQPHLRGAIQAMMGKLPAPLDPWFKRINSYGMFLNIITTLTFSALASFPDLAGPILRSREMDGFKTATKEYINYFENKEEAIKFAMDLGIVSQDTLATMYINAAEMDYMTLGTKKATDMFFRMIMLEQFTKFTRVFAANMGRAFLINLAHNNTKDPAVIKRWLKELGVTKEEILAWEKTKTAQGEYDFTTPEGRKVSDAIYRFVDESIIRPNAAQRPTWASNPYFALVWQLKGFFYAYGKTIMGGQGREIMNRYREAGLGPAMIPIAMMAMTILPLTMVGLEVREAVKYGMGGVLPGVPADPSVFKTDDMDGGTYTYEIFDRSGMAGSWGILLPILSGREYGGPFEQGASLLGPTSDKIGDLLKYGPFDNRFIKGQIPLYYTLPSQE